MGPYVSHARAGASQVRALRLCVEVNIWGELNSQVAEWLNKGLMAVWSPNIARDDCVAKRHASTRNENRLQVTAPG
eukprot:5980760-Pyramimonas_sp.AAC.1